MKKFEFTLCLSLLIFLFGNGCLLMPWPGRLPALSEEELRDMGRACLSQKNGDGLDRIVITSPENGAVFPPEIASPVFAWQDSRPGIRCWLVVVETGESEPVCRLTSDPFWEPDPLDWKGIKQRSVDTPATVTVFGLDKPEARSIVSHCSIQISTSRDRLDALVMYRQVPLPFMSGEKNFRKIVWRLGDVADYGEPRVVMRDIPVCTGCHQVSADGGTLAMEMNYNNDGGAQFITPVSESIVLEKSHFMTWSEVPRSPILPPTKGLFSRMSPSGRYLVSTVNEVIFFALTNDPAFCQLFFPTYGILVSYDVESGTFTPLKGADIRRYVQTSPEWSPDERDIVFARAENRNEYHDSVVNPGTRQPDLGIQELNRQFPMKFDLWKLPFNQGRGGEAQPLEGASGGGMSYYFPRYSPDGKWIVYTRSDYGIMLQPGSELWIIPAEGGRARRLDCNRGRMNSWHSWSPNGRWLAFSSKDDSMYTKIYLTHMDEQGNASPPVHLSRFSHHTLCANLPELVSPGAGILTSISLAGD